MARKNKLLKNEQSLSEPWDNLKKSNICVIGVLEDEIEFEIKRNI